MNIPRLLQFVLCGALFIGWPAAAQEDRINPEGEQRSPTISLPTKSTCFNAGRRVQCTFTLTFDASTGQFTEVRAGRGADSRPAVLKFPINRYTLPILTGDLLQVEVVNLPIGDRIEAGSTSASVTPFPRPSLEEPITLGTVALQSFASAVLPSIELESGPVIDDTDYRTTPSVFASTWNRAVRAPLEAYTDEVHKRADELGPGVERVLTRSANLFRVSGAVLAGRIQAMAKEVSDAESRIQAGCLENDHADLECLRKLEEASSLAARHAALQGTLRQFITALDLKRTVEVADSVSDLLQHHRVQRIIATDLGGYEKEVGPALPEFKKAAEPTPQELDQAKTLMSRWEVVQRLAQAEEKTGREYLDSLPPSEMLHLRENLRLVQGDADAIRKYGLLRRRLTDIQEGTHEALTTIAPIREEFENARVDLIAGTTRLAYTFDAAAARPQPNVIVPVFRTTGDEDVTITLTRAPRFTAGTIGPSTVAGLAGGKADSAANKSPAVPVRTYTERLRGRSKHYYQVIAGFAFSGIKSAKYGTVDALEKRDTDGDGKVEDVTVRRITKTAERPRLFVPVAQLVFHPLGKDVHPDAYKRWALAIPGLAIGTTLDAPLRNLSLGVAFEPLPGMHLSVGGLGSQVQELQKGYALDHEIPTTAAAPTRDDFDYGWYIGGMLDLSVFAGFFGKLLGAVK